MDRSMRIGFYHESAGTRHAGGIAVYTRRLAVELADRHEVTLYTREGESPSSLADAGVRLVRTPRFGGRRDDVLRRLTPLDGQSVAKLRMALWGVRNGLFEAIDRDQDLLVTFQYLDDLLVSNLVSVPTLFGYHGLASVGLGTHLRERLSRTDHVVVNSADTARRLRAQFGYDVDGVVYPGVDTDRFHPGVEPAADADRPTVLFVGRLVPEKGVFDLLEAVAALDRPLQVRFVGAGALEAVSERARELGIADEVVLRGELAHAELPAEYAAADVFCLPSHEESFGMVNVEAMACGTPVVTSRLPATEAYATDGESAMLVPPGRPDALAATLETVLDSPVLRERLGERGREVALQFSWERVADRFEEVCVSVLADAEPADARRPART